jgi:vitamin B12 transporter
MRSLRVFSCLLFLVAAASAEIRIKVVDSRLTAVSGAQVILLNGDTPVAAQSTTSDGVAVFANKDKAERVRVLAPGFAPAETDLAKNQRDAITVQLQVAPVAETVQVTATRGLVPTDAAGADVSALNAAQLQTMNPVAMADTLRFLPGAVIATAGRRGSISSLFVRGGDSRYNKVIVDGVPVDEPGGTFDFGVVPMNETRRLEFVRGAQSTLYGSDAMSSVVQTWSNEGRTRTPELKFGADGGNYDTAHGYLSLAGAYQRFDYNFFGDQFNTEGQGVNDDYSNSLQGGNIGVALSDRVALRVRARHSNSYTGVQGEYKFNGAELEPPDTNQWQRQNNLLASADLTVSGPSGWQHRITGNEYRHRRLNVNGDSPDRIFDSAFSSAADLNRAGLDYQGNYVERSWAQTTVGYEFEDENGFVGDPTAPLMTHGLRLNHAVYGQQQLQLNRLSVVAGARFVHNQTFGNKGVPRVALAFQALKGGDIFSGTRLRFSYATGIKESRFDEAFASGPFILPNPNLKAEENRAFEAGFQQGLFGGKYSLTGTYFNNLFRNQIDFAILDFTTFLGQYVNVNKSIAHGAEVELKGQLTSRLSLDAGYTYTSSQILDQPFAFDALHAPGAPLLRRPKHSGSLLFNYLGNRWGANLGGSFVGRRADSDFLIFNIDHAAGYARVDLGGWYAVTSRITGYANLENAFNHYYEEVVGYPALGANVRVGLRFRIGGE